MPIIGQMEYDGGIAAFLIFFLPGILAVFILTGSLGIGIRYLIVCHLDQRYRQRRGRCPDCDYDLRGTRKNHEGRKVCSECGKASSGHSS